MRRGAALGVVPGPFGERLRERVEHRQFEDPVLESLEGAALASNHGVRIAIARVQQARAAFDDVQVERYPTVMAGASEDVREQALPGFTDEPIRTNTYRAGFDAFWEIDLFGRVRSAVRAGRDGARGRGRGRAAAARHGVRRARTARGSR